jgi:hypothetical protein
VFDENGNPHDVAEFEFLRMMHSMEHFADTGEPGVLTTPDRADADVRSLVTVA